MKRKIPILRIILFSVFIAVLILYIGSRLSVTVSDFVNSTVGSFYRRVAATLTSPIPFSLFEIVIYLLPFAVALIIVLSIRAIKQGRALKFISSLLAFVLFVYSGHLLALGASYNTTPVESHLGLDSVEVTEQRLSDAMILYRDRANLLSEELTLHPDGGTDSGYTLPEISRLVCDSYSVISRDYGFIPDFYSNVKGVGFSAGLSYLGLTGIYTYYTGEANVNTQYPDYKLIFTSAHELAHQRGILRENEANFMAYLALETSEDIYFQYCAALNMYQYMSSALYRTNADLYYEIASGLSDIPRGDILRSNAIAIEYGDTFIEHISDFVNDLFLKSNGTEGIVSYGKVVRLAISYLESQKAD